MVASMAPLAHLFGLLYLLWQPWHGAMGAVGTCHAHTVSVGMGGTLDHTKLCGGEQWDSAGAIAAGEIEAAMTVTGLQWTAGQGARGPVAGKRMTITFAAAQCGDAGANLQTANKNELEKLIRKGGSESYGMHGAVEKNTYALVYERWVVDCGIRSDRVAPATEAMMQHRGFPRLRI
ncbi:hypothetical protein R3P38DRAFT_2767609 [Favolaschia claudopus]|uniref:Uncharacterized protein n=1 Tax=Favolaschia claudopus TaxID=2862362 RepID=A0AAW0CZB5_9AGAR